MPLSPGEILGSASTLLSGLIVWVVDRIFIFEKQLKYENIIKAKREAVKGKWKGKYSQVLFEEQITVPIELSLKVSRNGKLKGELYFSYNSIEYFIDVWGGFYLQKFIKLEYRNVKQEVDQFGSFVLELNACSDKLEGCFVGYGNKREEVISGPINLNKV